MFGGYSANLSRTARVALVGFCSALVLATACGPAAAGQETKSKRTARDNPFERRLDLPEFPRGLEWLNSRPLKLQELKGKFVLLDFWTYCCINCIHILPELKKLERAYPNQLVVIGVHSAKFDAEKDSKNISEAILRYEIEHPVVNDDRHQLWDTLGVSSWPTVLLIDPEGKLVWGRAGEFESDEVEAVLKKGLPYYRSRGLLDETPVRFELLADRQARTPLRFPGKLVADAPSNRLFIADSNHNRIVICDLAGKQLDVIGSSQLGRQDGAFEKAEFDHPQGMALQGNMLYIADTENHMIRRADLAQRRVTTVAGTGKKGSVPWPGLERVRSKNDLPEKWRGPAKRTDINSPWDLWVHKDALLIAMAGPHQIWALHLKDGWIGPYAGDGFEDIVDGRLLPKVPPAVQRFQKESGASSFAQPSGLCSDGQSLFVADSEGSSIRVVPLEGAGEVRTLIGTAELPVGRLFTFGDVDGPAGTARLQHALGVAYQQGKLFVADTYNNKIKIIDIASATVRTFAGDGQPGATDEPPRFDEPAGISIANDRLYVADTNNHLIRVVDIGSGQVSTLNLQGVTPPQRIPQRPSFATAQRHAQSLKLKPTDGAVRLAIELDLPEGLKINDLAPLSYWVTLAEGAEAGPMQPGALGQHEVAAPKAEFLAQLPVSGPGQTRLELALEYYYCSLEGGLCRVGSVVWEIDLTVAQDGQEQGLLTHLHQEAP